MQDLSEVGRFATVVIDPPWPLEWATAGDRGSGYHSTPYPLMSIDDIKALSVPNVLTDDAFVFCWTVQKFLPGTYGVIEAWKLRYAFTMTWHKNGGPQGRSMPAYNAEFVVVAKSGNPRFTDTRAFATCNSWPRRAHSEKPEEFYDLLRRVTPEPRLDIFGRRRIARFRSWGNEAPEGPALPNQFQDVLDLGI